MFLSTPRSFNFLLLLLCVDVSVASAESTTTAAVAATTADLFNLAYPVVAFPIASGKHDATTYLIACPTGTETSSCEFEQPFTMISGPKTLYFEFVTPAASSTQTFILDCALRGTTSMGCKATGISDHTSPSAPITTTEALTYTGDAAKGFFRPISLVQDSRALMTHTLGAPQGDGVYKTDGNGRTRTATATSTSTGSGSAVTKAATMTSMPSITVALTTTPFETYPASVSGAATPIVTTTSGAGIRSVNSLFVVFAVLAVLIAVGDSVS